MQVGKKNFFKLDSRTLLELNGHQTTNIYDYTRNVVYVSIINRKLQQNASLKYFTVLLNMVEIFLVHSLTRQDYWTKWNTGKQ